MRRATSSSSGPRAPARRRRGRLRVARWTLEGIGAGRGPSRRFRSAGRIGCRCCRASTLDEYRTLLPGYDVGLSLMLTPHPSLVPLEMAAAGLLTVTQHLRQQDAAGAAALSSNLMPVAPTVDGDRGAGSPTPIARAGDHDRRVAGSRVAWSRELVGRASTTRSCARLADVPRRRLSAPRCASGSTSRVSRRRWAATSATRARLLRALVRAPGRASHGGVHRARLRAAARAARAPRRTRSRRCRASC